MFDDVTGPERARIRRSSTSSAFPPTRVAERRMETGTVQGGGEWNRFLRYARNDNRLQEFYQIIQGIRNAIEEEVHEFGLDGFGDVDEGAFAAAGEVAGFGVGAAAGGEDEDAGVGPFQGFKIGLKLLLSQGVLETLSILVESPVQGVFVDTCPFETVAAVWGIAEVIDTVSFGAEALYHFGEIGVPPAGGDVDLCHETKIRFFPGNRFHILLLNSLVGKPIFSATRLVIFELCIKFCIIFNLCK